MSRPPIQPHDPVAVMVVGEGVFFDPLIDTKIDAFVSGVLLGAYTMLSVRLRNGQGVNVRKRRAA